MKELSRLSKTMFVLSLMKFILIVSMILSIVLWSIPIISFNPTIWSFLQEKSDVILNQADAEFYNRLIAEFLKYGGGLPFLNEQEFSHMEDVRRVIITANVLFIVSFLALLTSLNHFTKTDKKFLIGTVRKTSLTIFIISTVILFLVLTNFYLSFDVFHRILFTKNFIFPASSILKILYPDGFFLGLGVIYLLSIIIVSLIAVIISHRLKLK